MCRATTCKQCNKPTWAGCGAHVEQVLGHVPPRERCNCKSNATSNAAVPKHVEAQSSWLSRLSRLTNRKP